MSKSCMHRSVRWMNLSAGVLLASAMSMTPALAAEFCVSTAVELQNALTAASDGGAYVGETNFVYLVAGTYNSTALATPGTFTYVNSSAFGSMNIYGGYDSGCATRTANALSTVLDGNNTYRVMFLERATGSINLTNVTIQNGESLYAGGGLLANPSGSDKSTIVILGNVFRGNHTSDLGGGVFAGSNGTGAVAFDVNLVYDNSADGGAGGAYLVANGAPSEVYNNTVYKNTTLATTGSLSTGGVICDGAANYFIINNIFWQNSNYGVYVLTAGTAQVEYNDAGTFGGKPYDVDTGNQSQAPKFVDATDDNFHLAADSPLLGASPEVFVLTDLDGNRYPINGVEDMGVYEETIFANGFSFLPAK